MSRWPLETRAVDWRARAVAVLALVAAAMATAAMVHGCSKLKTFDAPGGLVQYDAGPGGPPDGAVRPYRPVLANEIAPVMGFVSPDSRVEYYYLGEVDRVGQRIPVNPIYFFYDQDDTPLFRLRDDNQALVGWHPVVNVVPTQLGYSPFWRVVHVRVNGRVDRERLAELAVLPPRAEQCQMDAVCGDERRCIENRCTSPLTIGAFQLDGVKSLQTLKESKLVFTETSTVINCPIVDADAKLIKGISAPDLPFPKIQLWFRRYKAFCLLMQGGEPLLGNGLPAVQLAQDEQPATDRAYFVRRRLNFGTDRTQWVLPARNLVLTERLPAAGYHALVEQFFIEVDREHEFLDLRSLAQAKQNRLPITPGAGMHNLVVRGTIPRCSSDADCAGTGGRVDPPLKCSAETEYCSPPFARLAEECRRGVKECDPRGGPGGTPLVCVGLRVRDKFFCFNACDSSQADENDDTEIDTRCGSAPRTRCFSLRRTDPTRPNGVCIQLCDSRGRDRADRLAQCVSSACGNGKLEYGEACDDGNRVGGDGCNEFCALSTLVRCDNQSDCNLPGQTCAEPQPEHGSTYCLPPLRRDEQGQVVADQEKDEREDDDAYRSICMEFDYCWPPDGRADWLGTTSEDGQ